MIMKKLTELRAALESLPSIRVARDNEARFKQFLDLSVRALESLRKAKSGAMHAGSNFPESIREDVGEKIRSASDTARRLSARLSADPGDIAQQRVETSFIAIFDNAKAGLVLCERSWEDHLERITNNWKALSDGVMTLAEREDAVRDQSRRLKGSIDALTKAKGALPQSASDAQKVDEMKRDLTRSVEELHLNTPFGRFFRAASSPEGADLDALTEEVMDHINQLGLKKAFRIRLSN